MFLKTIKNVKDTTLEGEMQIINPYVLMMRLWFTKSLRLRDPNESLRKPKHWAFEMPQALRAIPLDDVGIHKRR